MRYDIMREGLIQTWVVGWNQIETLLTLVEHVAFPR